MCIFTQQHQPFFTCSLRTLHVTLRELKYHREIYLTLLIPYIFVPPGKFLTDSKCSYHHHHLKCVPRECLRVLKFVLIDFIIYCGEERKVAIEINIHTFSAT